MTRWLTRWRDRPDPALAQYAARMTSRRTCEGYDYAQAVAGKRRAEQQQAAVTLAHAARSQPAKRKTNVRTCPAKERA